MKSLQELNLLDRFLFDEAMEDSETMEMTLDIIMDAMVTLKAMPQTEKEIRSSINKRYIKLDVWAQDVDGTVYDTEVQQENTGNIPRRSRYYQSLIDRQLLPPGETDFNKLKNAYIIMIAPFDLFGCKRYRYTFRMKCDEEQDIELKDGAVRIFLNTHGTDEENINPELKELLQYFEHTNDEVVSQCKSQRIQRMHKKIQTIKSSEEIGVKYMQEWEEKELIRKEATEQGIEQGVGMGEDRKLKSLIETKLAKGRTIPEIAEDLEESVAAIEQLIAEMREQSR